MALKSEVNFADARKARAELVAMADHFSLCHTMDHAGNWGRWAGVIRRALKAHDQLCEAAVRAADEAEGRRYE